MSPKSVLSAHTTWPSPEFQGALAHDCFWSLSPDGLRTSVPLSFPESENAIPGVGTLLLVNPQNTKDVTNPL